jgi:drug/metabolite transporter (DMT)-like permease
MMKRIGTALCGVLASVLGAALLFGRNPPSTPLAWVGVAVWLISLTVLAYYAVWPEHVQRLWRRYKPTAGN